MAGSLRRDDGHYENNLYGFVIPLVNSDQDILVISRIGLACEGSPLTVAAVLSYFHIDIYIHISFCCLLFKFCARAFKKVIEVLSLGGYHQGF